MPPAHGSASRVRRQAIDRCDHTSPLVAGSFIFHFSTVKKYYFD
jgi:hypothetical protein